MKKKILAVLAAFTLIFGTVGCQSAAKNFGGDYTLKLPKNEKLVMITWKNNSLWYLTKTMTEDDIAETYKFQESADLGIMEGTVTVVETKEESVNGENE